MKENTPRIRMFAGPNGSGKSTIKSVISSELLGLYINPDEIEATILNQGYFSFKPYQIKVNAKEVSDFFLNSSLIKEANLLNKIENLSFSDEKIIFDSIEINSYFASVISDFVRQKLIESKRSFSFETVMSVSDKIDLLNKAQKQGYRTYLYSENPEINISRVENRVKMGGHSVPKDKIVSRYYRSLDLLMSAVQSTDRAYIFDNSRHKHIFLAEITNGKTLEMKIDIMPEWFKKALWDKFNNNSSKN